MRQIPGVKSTRLAFIVLAALWIAFAAYVWQTTAQLPERVATHFDAAGTPNGWMTRIEHMRFTLIFGTLAQAFIVGVFTLIRALGGRGMNIPNRDYWLAPERQQATVDFVQRHGLWLASLMVAFIAGIHGSILRANAHAPATLPLADVGWIAGGFGAAVLVWAVLLVVRFARRPA
jgi:serine/threonine-protein kinase